ncbi:MAG: hypothetical protein H7296_02005 [Bacteroidia bacterium]|nr:hypothetical protein [Bacteroidia bacterium]
MKNCLTFIILFYVIGCDQVNQNIKGKPNTPEDIYAPITNDKPLRPYLNQASFDTLHSWDFGWAILQPLKTAKDDVSEKRLMRRFSSGQKALYSFWYLD